MRLATFVGTLLVCAVLAPAAQACTITWDGQLSDRWFELQPNGPGAGDDVYNWSPERYPTSTDDVCFPSGSVASTRQVTQNTPDVRSFAIAEGATLTVSDVQMIVRENSTNAGTLNMSGPVPLTINDSEPADGGQGLTNTGTINFTNQGAANGQLAIIVAELFSNQGTVNVDDPEAGIQRSGTGLSLEAVHLNQGTINISAGNTLRSIFSNFINTGSIAGGGSMNMDQGRFEAASGSQIGAGTDVNITNSVFAGAPGSTATGNVDIFGAFNGGGPSTLEGTVPAGITLDVEPQVTLRAPPVDTTANAGRINLNGNGSHLQVLPNDTGTNSTSKLTNTGTIEFTGGASDGFKFLTGNVVNQGSILVNHPQSSFQFPGGTNSVPQLTNLGNVAIAPGAQLRVLSAAFAQDPAGTLTLGIAGADFGRIAADVPIALAGTLSLQTSGAPPALGQQFKIITASTVTGAFGSVQEAGANYDVAYNPTDVTLTAAVAPPGGDPAACAKAETKLDKAKKKLKKLKRNDAPGKKIKKAKKKVKKAKDAVREACA